MASREEIKKAFEKALNRLERTRQGATQNRHVFVCHAIHNHALRRSAGQDAAIAIVRERLDGHNVVEDWLQSQGIETKNAGLQTTMLDYRIRWVKELIREFS